MASRSFVSCCESVDDKPGSDLSKPMSPCMDKPIFGGGASWAITLLPLVINTVVLDIRTASMVCAMFLARSVAEIHCVSSILILTF